MMPLGNWFLCEEGNSFLINRTHHDLCLFPTLSASWGGTSSIRHPKDPHQNPESTKNTTEATRICLVVSFIALNIESKLSSAAAPYGAYKCKKINRFNGDHFNYFGLLMTKNGLNVRSLHALLASLLSPAIKLVRLVHVVSPLKAHRGKKG